MNIPLRFGCVLFLLLLLGLPQLTAGPIVTGTDFPSTGTVKYFSTATPNAIHTFEPYTPGFIGGVRVATGDVNGDGVADIITAPGAGLGPNVRVFDGLTRALIRNFNAFEAGFTGGLFVAAGDVNGDGTADIIAATDASNTGGPRVAIFRGTDLQLIGSFFAYNPAFTGGVRVAAGDVNGDGLADIITGAGSTAPHVKVFDARGQTLIASFMAYASNFDGGVYVAAGDINGDGFADVITGAGPGAGPHVKVFTGGGAQLRSFFAYEAGFNGGVRVAAGDVNNDGRADVITSPGPGRGPLVRAFSGRTGAQVASFNAYAADFVVGFFIGSVAAPAVRATTNPATNITETTATLNGTVDPNGRTVTVRFQYGLTTSYGTTVNATPPTVNGTTPVAVSADITGLIPGRTYNFRVIVNDGIGGTVVGANRTFVTSTNDPPAGGAFVVTPPSPVPAGTVLTASFTGWTDPEGHTPLTYEVREGNIVIVPRTEDATSQFTLPPGTHLLTGRIYDSLGGVAESGPVEVVVTGDSESAVLFASREPVPGAGSGGVPADASWKGFGPPAIAEGSVKFFATFGSPSGRGGGIFSNGTAVAVVRGAVPGAGGGPYLLPADAVFKSFRDPVTSPGGHIAFLATIAGTDVTNANDGVVVSNARTGALEVIAREGSPAPGVPSTTFLNFLSVSVGGEAAGGTIFTARLRGAPASANHGAWWLPAGSSSPILLVRKGDPGFATGETIRSFVLHQSWPGTPGHGRGQVDENEALLQVMLSSGRQAQVLATPDALDPVAITGDPVGTSSVWVRMAQPSHGNGGQFLTTRGTFRSNASAPNSPPGTGILRSLDSGSTWTVEAALGDEAPGIDGLWIDLGHPVNSSTSGDYAFLGRVRGETIKPANDSGIWWKSGAGGIRLLAQEGAQAVGCPAGVKFRQFRSLAYPGGAPGPLFVATLAGPSVSGFNDTGVWTVDSSGSLRLLFRKGQRIDTKRVAGFTVLSSVIGSPGVTRSFNENGQVAWKATFTDGTTGIVVTDIP